MKKSDNLKDLIIDINILLKMDFNRFTPNDPYMGLPHR